MSKTKIFTKAQAERIACFAADNIHSAIVNFSDKQTAEGLRSFKENLLSQILEDNLEGSKEEFSETIMILEFQEEIRGEKKIPVEDIQELPTDDRKIETTANAIACFFTGMMIDTDRMRGKKVKVETIEEFRKSVILTIDSGMLDHTIEDYAKRLAEQAKIDLIEDANA